MAMITTEAKTLLQSVLDNAIKVVEEAKFEAVGRSGKNSGSDRYNDLKDAASFQILLRQLRHQQESWIKKEGCEFMTEILSMTTKGQEALAQFDSSMGENPSGEAKETDGSA